ncbi:hypothetical protein [uncultured Maribacter sp.]|uniref:hypothetical protein n=1 Tax=uncultured Maribacter sp. TaxID=431308 RepID=UPI00261C4049|nr:hypothetical protein [uncultured Maribacter sp.]
MREKILELLYEWSKKPYQKFMKNNTPWHISTAKLQSYPQGTLGQQLGLFLKTNNFRIEPKLESHDVFHVLTNTGTSVPEEISMQYYLLGNGKRSIYLITVIVLGTILFPDYITLFYRAYQRGKIALPFYQLNFLKMLQHPIEKIKSTFKIQ